MIQFISIFFLLLLSFFTFNKFSFIHHHCTNCRNVFFFCGWNEKTTHTHTYTNHWTKSNQQKKKKLFHFIKIKYERKKNTFEFCSCNKCTTTTTTTTKYIHAYMNLQNFSCSFYCEKQFFFVCFVFVVDNI